MITCIRTFFVPNLKTYRRPKTKMTPPVDLIIIMYKPMLPITIPRNYLNCAFSDSSTINLFDTFNPAFSFRPPEFGQEAQPPLSPTQSTYRTDKGTRRTNVFACMENYRSHGYFGT